MMDNRQDNKSDAISPHERRSSFPSLNRRDFLGGAAALATTLLTDKMARSTETSVANDGNRTDWSAIRGFNYQPSYGSSGLELWRQFDAAVIETELTRGKKYFPKMNAIRLWLSWDAFLRNPKRLEANFETALAIADRVGTVVLPVLFNRWHSPELDFGGIYIDHFLPSASWVQKPGMFDAYMEAIVGGHKDDRRILAWDLCNEPFAYSCSRESIPQVVDCEFGWLKGLYEKCKQLAATAPVTVGIWSGVPMKMIEPISDILSIHPYWKPTDSQTSKADFEKELDDALEFAERAKKPLLATECCWGSLDDALRVEIVRYSLTQLRKRRIGWLAYVLHHSLVADSHRPEFGPVGAPENLAFIEADGTMRPGHELFNEFCE